MSYTFYAVSDEEGVIAITSSVFTGLKAVFDNREDAEKALKTVQVKYPDVKFTLEAVRLRLAPGYQLR